MKKRNYFLPLAGIGVVLVTFFCVNPDKVITYLLIATIIILLAAIVSIVTGMFQGKGSVDNGEEYIKQELTTTAKNKLSSMSDSIEKLAVSFDHMSGMKEVLDQGDTELILRDISENLCKNCKKCSFCWEKNFQENIEIIDGLVKIGVENGTVTGDDLPDRLKDHCIRVPDFVEETNRNLSLAKLKLSWHNRMAESREAVASSLGEIARIVNDFSNNLCDTGEVIELKRRKINAKLRMNHIKVQRILMFERESRGMELHVTAKCANGRCITTKEAAALIGSALNKKFIPREDSKNVIGRDYSDFVFCEDANYKVLTGVARIAKNKDEVSGDNFSFLYPGSQDVIMMLSDGMGTGESASEESELVIELLEQFLEAGFHEEAAVRLINSALVLRSEHTMFSTVDICIVNLCSGTCEFVKMGAATTFIKRDHYVETIGASSVPAGMLNKIDYEKKTKKLYNGDYIIMISDGVLDSIAGDDKEGCLQKIIKNITYKTPQDLANAIMTAALNSNAFIPEDDMTVLVTGIWRK